MPDKEREAEEARRKPEETERRADQTLERAEEKLRELTEEQEATAERLRKEFREATGLRFPRTQEVEEDGEEGEAGG